MEALARGVLIVDENLTDLIPWLNGEDMNFKTRGIPLGASVEDLQQHYLPASIFVTNNCKDFVEGAINHGYSIVATEIVSKDPKSLATMISKAIARHKLWSKDTGWLLQLQHSGRHEFRQLRR